MLVILHLPPTHSGSFFFLFCLALCPERLTPEGCFPSTPWLLTGFSQQKEGREDDQRLQGGRNGGISPLLPPRSVPPLWQSLCLHSLSFHWIPVMLLLPLPLLAHTSNNFPLLPVSECQNTTAWSFPLRIPLRLHLEHLK